MKATIGCVAVVTTLLTGSVILAADDNNNEDWLKKHAVIKTTETTDRDANGNIRSIRVVNDTTVYIKQTVTEVQKPDAKGKIYTASRTTYSLDTLGGSATITETVLAGTTKLVTSAITTIEKTSDGAITTTYGRDKAGNMGIISQATSVNKYNGVAPTVVVQ